MTGRGSLASGLALALAALSPPADAQGSAPRGIVSRGEDAREGYTLLAPLRSPVTYLIDLEGNVVHTWQDDLSPGFAVYLLPGGRLLRVCRRRSPGFVGSAQGGLLREFDWDGRKTWEFSFTDGQRHLHHDVEPLPNGNVLVIAWELRSAQEARSAGRDPELVVDIGFRPCTVLEVRPTRPVGGEVIWQWSAWDHLIQDRDEALPNYGSVADHPERLDLHADRRASAGAGPGAESDEARAQRRQLAQLGYVDSSDPEEPPQSDRRPGRTRRRRAAMADWLHVNSVDFLPEHDLIVLSSRHLSEVFVLDHSTTTEEAAGSSGGRWGRGGDLLYRWGNPQNYGGGTPDDQVLFGQHDARWRVEGDGTLTLSVFNNGLRRRWSSVEVIELPFDASEGFLRDPDGPFGPPNAHWTWSAPEPESLFSPAISGAQPLEGGHMLVCSGTQGRVLEVTASGEVVWEFENDLGRPTRGRRPSVEPSALVWDVPPPPGMWDSSPRGAVRPKVSALFRATRIPADDPRLIHLRAGD